MKSQTDDMFRLDGETALVTGGGSGIGLAIAQALIGAGAKVVIVGRREATIRQAAEQIGSHGVIGDVRDMTALPALVEQAQSAVGDSLSILVNNAGVHHKADAVDTTDEVFASVFATHVFGAFALAREVGRQMLQVGHGNIVFIGSMAAVMGVPRVPAYSAAKGAVQSLAPALAAEWSSQGVRVNTVTPGWIDTEMSRRALDGDPQRKAKVIGRTPIGRLGMPQDIGNAVVYLCSEAGRFVTGTNLFIDGGASRGF